MPEALLEKELQNTEAPESNTPPEKNKKREKKKGSFLWRFFDRHFPKVTPFLHPIIFFFALCALDYGFRSFYQFAVTIDPAYVIQLNPFTIGWALLLCGISLILPAVARRIFMVVAAFVPALLCGVHGFFINMFGKFFSFSDMAFLGDGAAFADTSYIMISKVVLAYIIFCFLLAIVAVLLVPPKAKVVPIASIEAVVVGIAVILSVRYAVLGKNTEIIWDQNDDPAFLYQDFSDTRNNLTMLGIYQYTFRDLTNVLNIGGGISAEETKELEAWVSERGHTANEMSGIYEGKNLMLIQLEAIDTWMIDEDYMPNLYGIKQESLQFTKHHTPAYITAGTFNTEFMVNTGLLPAASGTPTTVYTKNDFSNSIASLFAKEAYKVQSFHGSEADVYNRGNVHANLGYEKYWSGNDMGMHDYQLDRFLMSGYEQMTSADKFFSFVITFSGHGPYGENNWIGIQHIEEARKVAKRTDGNYVYAVAHAMETDMFVGELVAKLKEDGLMENTVLIFYADHCNYYMLDDRLNMDIKGVDTLNKLTNTDLFIYDGGAHVGTVDKVTASIDVLPTVANLFNLDCDYASIIGHDAFSEDGGYVFFQDNSWFDGETWSGELRQDVLNARRMGQLILKDDWFEKKK